MSVSKVCSAQARPGPSIGPKRKSPCFLPVSGRCRLISVVSTTSQLLNSERERERGSSSLLEFTVMAMT